jgi:hypothetical protein
MNLIQGSKVVLVLPALMVALAQPAQAQCNHGGSGGGQGRMQSFARQSMLSSAMNQPQLTSFSNGSSGQQNNLTSVMQQQLAMLTALQQGRPVSSVQQPRESQLGSQTGGPDLAAGRAKSRQRRSKSRLESDAIPAPMATVVLDSATQDEIAARRLRLAEDLADNAVLAGERGERRAASRLRERANERLQEIVENYRSTSSAEKAKNLLRSTTNELSATFQP